VCWRWQAQVLFVGRVCCDGEGRLNEASAQLEGDIATSKGARVRLDLSRVPALRIFTGQVRGPDPIPADKQLRSA
jgi:DNA polymerase alpha subunit B